MLGVLGVIFAAQLRILSSSSSSLDHMWLAFDWLCLHSLSSQN
jgi:hypothetical protein